jgi:hypothetical protein
VAIPKWHLCPTGPPYMECRGGRTAASLPMSPCYVNWLTVRKDRPRVRCAFVAVFGFSCVFAPHDFSSHMGAGSWHDSGSFRRIPITRT